MSSSLPPLQCLLKFMKTSTEVSLDMKLDSHIGEGLKYMTEYNQITTVLQDTISSAQS